MLKKRSALRLVVVQVMVLALFATLFGRLWYLQIAGGRDYQAAAKSNAVRQVEVPAPRGLIVDNQGRPLVANRTSWVVTVDRGILETMPSENADAVKARLAALLGMSVSRLEVRLRVCGEEGAAPSPVCWNGSPYSPVPVAEDVSESLAASILEQREDYPGVTAEPRKVRAYPSPSGANAAHLLGYTSPITAQEYRQAQERDKSTLGMQSVVGRAGLESQYDRVLRGKPGHRDMAVDSLGNVLGNAGYRAPTPGKVLVTHIDAKVQSVAERELREAILAARQEFDDNTGRNYEADSGAAVVLDSQTGGVVAAASYPSYDPGVWVNGISQRQLTRLYSKRAGTPLLFRATQAQLAPGSTFKPFTSLGALTHGYSPSTQLNCTSDYTVGDRTFKNYESADYGIIGFPVALAKSCDTFYYRIAHNLWLENGGSVSDVNARDPLVETAKMFGFGSLTGIDIPGEEPGRIADRKWKLEYWKAQKDYYCKIAKEEGQDYEHRFAREFCAEGFAYRPGDAVNFSIGQGDTIVTPMQLAVAYASLVNGGKLLNPQVAKAVLTPDGELVRTIKPQVNERVDISQGLLRYIDRALVGTSTYGTYSWKLGGFPLDRVKIRSKTGTAEVYGKQTTSWLATYNERYVVIMMISQGGTGSGASGDSVRGIWEALYGIKQGEVNLDKAAQPGARPAERLPKFGRDGRISAPRVSTVADTRGPAGRREDD